MKVGGAFRHDGAIGVVEGGDLFPFRVGEQKLAVLGLLRVRSGQDLLVLGNQAEDSPGMPDRSRSFPGLGTEEKRRGSALRGDESAGGGEEGALQSDAAQFPGEPALAGFRVDRHEPA